MGMDEERAEHIVKRLARFICDANAEIMRFTKNRGHIHDTGSEGYVSGYIANRIYSENLLVDGEYVDHVRLEVSVTDRVDVSTEARKTGRFDIVCFNENGDAILIIEVKRYFSPSALKEDASRLISAIRMSRATERHLKGGVLVGVNTDWGKVSRTTVSEQLEQVESTIRDYENDVHTWGGVHEEPVLIEGENTLKKVIGFAVLIKG